jgi:hypothetical protein
MRRRPLLATMALALILFAVATCGDDERSDPPADNGSADDFCRENPGDCDGDIGGSCTRTEDCVDGVCCTDNANCNGGMCLYSCDRTADCPSNQRCEHGQCFFSCDRDSDCGAGQTCEHMNTVCEYP